MVYATAEQLAAAVRLPSSQVEPRRDDLESCIAAASAEIDHELDRPTGWELPTPAPALVVQVCLARAVEWWKSSDVAFGALGFDNTGVLTAPRDTFARHAATLIPLKIGHGVA